MSWFASVAPLPPDPVFGLNEAFNVDPRKEKLNLTVGAYRDEHLHPVIFHATKHAEELLLAKEKDKEYLPMTGDALFLQHLGELAFGKKDWGEYQNHVAAVQTAGGTGALRIGAEFLRTVVHGHLYISEPTWPNHRHVMHQSGFTIHTYPYYDAKHHCVCFEKLMQFCETLPASSVLLLHLSCHNPTGCDLSLDEWRQLSRLMRAKKLFPFFDCAYQGFGDGIEEDIHPLRTFIDDGHEFLLAYSCSKNFSLYCERVGALFIFSSEESICKNLLSVLRMKTRAIVSTPPAHGARIVSCILDTPFLYKMWKEELEQVAGRTLEMRHKLAEALGAEYAFIKEGKGLFCITGLNPEQIERLKKERGIYMTLDGRINVAGLNEEAIGFLADAMRKMS